MGGDHGDGVRTTVCKYIYNYFDAHLYDIYVHCSIVFCYFSSQLLSINIAIIHFPVHHMVSKFKYNHKWPFQMTGHQTNRSNGYLGEDTITILIIIYTININV